MCIEGFEHIPQADQPKLVQALHDSLTHDGSLIITSPENHTGISGKSDHNPHHLCKLNKADFEKVLAEQFEPDNVEITTTQPTMLTTGVRTRLLLAVCHRTG